MQTNNIRLGNYRHYRTKKLYKVIGDAYHSETHEEMVVYQALYNCETFGDQQIWVRPKKMFLEPVMVDEKMVSRFEWISE